MFARENVTLASWRELYAKTERYLSESSEPVPDDISNESLLDRGDESSRFNLPALIVACA